MKSICSLFSKKKVQINGPVVGGARGWGDFAGTFHQPFLDKVYIFTDLKLISDLIRKVPMRSELKIKF